MIISPSNKNIFITDKNNINISKKDSRYEKGSKIIKDQIDISSIAEKSSKLSQYINYANSLPDIRQDKVESAKANLKKYIKKDGSIDPNVLDNIVNNISKTIL